MAYIPPTTPPPQVTGPQLGKSLDKFTFEGLLGTLSKLTRIGLFYHRKLIYLDGLTFVECSFENCRFITTNGTFTLRQCRIYGPETVFEYGGAALRIVQLHELMNSSVNGRIIFPTLFPHVDPDARVTIG